MNPVASVAVVTAAAAAITLGACTTAPAPSSTPHLAPPRPTAPPAATPPVTPLPARPAVLGLASQLEVHSLDAAVSETILEFVSDGASILFSSAMGGDAAPEAAPDLWRVTPGPGAEPELVWRNPDRSRSIVKVVGDVGLLAWVDVPVTGERAWTLWVWPREKVEPIAIDTHPGDEDVPSLVPSIAVHEDTVVWTAFDRGVAGAVSQLITARAPAWRPHVIEERDALEAELWLPSLRGGKLAYAEVVYLDDRRGDERRVWLRELDDRSAPAIRLDTSGRATMPLVVDGGVLWKEADPGFNMFNWGRMFRHDTERGETRALSTRPQEYVNYPSAGNRYVAWWGADSFAFGIYDLRDDHPTTIARYTESTQESVPRAHVAGDLLAWLYIDLDAPGGPYRELRYAFLPTLKDLEP